jgi:hypothetical protein
VQNLAGASSAIASGMLYDGSVRNLTFLMGFFGIATGIVFLLRGYIARSSGTVT